MNEQHRETTDAPVPDRVADQGSTRPQGGALGRVLGTRVGVALAALAVGGAVGYAVSEAPSDMHQAEVACLSAPETISCGDVDSPEVAEYAVPVDVAWTKDGTFHDGGRPECLPPTGIGAVEVSVTWAEVEVEGMRWQQVVGVHC